MASVSYLSNCVRKSVGFFNSSSTLYYSSSRRNITIINVANGEILRTLENQPNDHDEEVVFSCLLSNDTQIFNLFENGIARLVDAVHGRNLTEIDSNLQPITSAALVERQTNRLTIGVIGQSSFVGFSSLWRLSFDFQENFRCCQLEKVEINPSAMSTNKFCVAAAGRAKTGFIVSASRPSEERRRSKLFVQRSGDGGPIVMEMGGLPAESCLAAHPTEMICASGYISGETLIWQWNWSGQWKVLSRWSWHSRPLLHLAFTMEGHHLVSGGYVEVLLKTHLLSRTHEFLPRLPAPVRRISVSADDSLFALHLNDDSIQLISSSFETLQTVQSVIRSRAPNDQISAYPVGLVRSPLDGSIVSNGHPGGLQFFSCHKKRLLFSLDVVGENYFLTERKGQYSATISYVTTAAFGRFPFDVGSSSDGRHDHGLVDDWVWLATCEFWPSVDVSDGKGKVSGIKSGSEERLKLWLWNFKEKNFQLSYSVLFDHYAGSEEAKKGNVVQLAFNDTANGVDAKSILFPALCVVSGWHGFELWEHHEEKWSSQFHGTYNDYSATAANFCCDGQLAVSFGPVLTLWRCQDVDYVLCRVVALTTPPSAGLQCQPRALSSFDSLVYALLSDFSLVCLDLAAGKIRFHIKSGCVSAFCLCREMPRLALFNKTTNNFEIRDCRDGHVLLSHELPKPVENRIEIKRILKGRKRMKQKRKNDEINYDLSPIEMAFSPLRPEQSDGKHGKPLLNGPPLVWLSLNKDDPLLQLVDADDSEAVVEPVDFTAQPIGNNSTLGDFLKRNSLKQFRRVNDGFLSEKLSKEDGLDKAVVEFFELTPIYAMPPPSAYVGTTLTALVPPKIRRESSTKLLKDYERHEDILGIDNVLRLPMEVDSQVARKDGQEAVDKGSNDDDGTVETAGRLFDKQFKLLSDEFMSSFERLNRTPLN